MTLSYLVDPFGETGKRKKTKARITTGHSASSYGQPVIALPDGSALDLMSWIGCGYRLEKATQQERASIAKILGSIALGVGV